MRFTSLRLAALVVLAGLTSGCGTGSFNASDVTVTVTPATAAILVNGQVTLQATVHHGCAGCVPFYNWVISENDGADCTWQQTPPTGPCPGGTLQAPSVEPGPTVTYIAPSTAGTYHVNGQSLYFTSLAGPPSTVAQGTSVVTVNP